MVLDKYIYIIYIICDDDKFIDIIEKETKVMSIFSRKKKQQSVQPSTQHVDPTKGGGVCFTTVASDRAPESHYTLIETNKPGIMALTGGRQNEDGSYRFNNLLVKKPEGIISEGHPLTFDMVDNQGNVINRLQTKEVKDRRALSNVDKYIIPEMQQSRYQELESLCPQQDTSGDFGNYEPNNY